jgi:peptidoglycan/xylan/chitin deacetylase (PgdA/CDA1 family)
VLAGAVGVIAISLATCTIHVPPASGATALHRGGHLTASASSTAARGGTTSGTTPGTGKTSGDHGGDHGAATGGFGPQGLTDPGWKPMEDGHPSWPATGTRSPTGTGARGGGPVTGAPHGTDPNGAPGNGPVVGGAGIGSAPLPLQASSCPAVTGAAWHDAPGAGRTIALTFDDGPGPQTRAVLDVLAAEHIHATFFVVGAAVRTDPGAVTRAAAGGHLIANHTWDHAYPREVRHGWTTAYLTDQITRTDAAVVAATGRPTCFFRPPGGFMPSTVGVIGRRTHERVVLWSVDPRDWAVQGAHDPGPARTSRQAQQIYLASTAGRTQAHPVLLLHDSGGYRGATVAALPRIIAYYRSLGYRFVRLDGRS